MPISPKHRDVLRELVNVGVRRAAAELNELLDSPIELHVPNIEVMERIPSQRPASHTLSLVQLPFEGPFTGRALLAFPPESATKLVCLLMDEEIDPVVLGNMRAGTLTEIGNILLNCVMGSITNLLNTAVRYRVPSFYEDELPRFINHFQRSATVLAARTTFCVRDLAIEGEIHLVFAVDAFEALVQAVKRASAA